MVFQKDEYFCDMKLLWIFISFLGGGGGGWGHLKNGLFLGVISMHFRVCLRSMYRIGIFFGVAKISNIFMPEFQILFWEKQ